LTPQPVDSTCRARPDPTKNGIKHTGKIRIDKADRNASRSIGRNNPSEGSPFEYFRAERHSRRRRCLDQQYAWALRHIPVFGVFGSGDYRVPPIYADDLAELAVTQGRERTTQVIDAIGPGHSSTESWSMKSSMPLACVARFSVPARIGPRFPLGRASTLAFSGTDMKTNS
jgi:hypothetical protein